ncbi:MAG: hypothetical protein V3U87_18020 [Methylococcaceae bacterium]
MRNNLQILWSGFRFLLNSALNSIPFLPKRTCKPEVVFIGGQEKTLHLLRLYGLNGLSSIAICDRYTGNNWKYLFSNIVVSIVNNIPVRQLSEIDFTNVKSIVLTNAYNEHDDINWLQQHQVPVERCINTFQANQLHTLLINLPGAQTVDLQKLGYEAIYHDVFEKAFYAYGVLLAAEEAKRMGLSRVSIVELGVWFGGGLKSLCEICGFLQQTIGMNFDIYGFDTGAGLPELTDYRDHPELWDSGTMEMPDFEVLAAELPPNCNLIIGNVSETIPEFIKNKCTPESPIGFVSLDVDLYSSSLDGLKIFEADAECLLPAVMIWEDDSYSNVLQNSYCGEALAIKDFNENHELRKIDKKVVRTNRESQPWHHSFYFAHIFDHPVRTGEKKANFDLFFHWFY